MDIFSTIAMYLMLVCLFEKQWSDDGFMKTHQMAPTIQADRQVQGNPRRKRQRPRRGRGRSMTALRVERLRSVATKPSR
jgi:hypothetical protein